MQNETVVAGPLKKRFWFFFFLSIAAYLLMRFLSNGLSADNIIDFEMLRSAEEAQATMNAWGIEGSDNFIKSIYGDFLFIIGYAGTLFYGCRFLGMLSGHYVLRKAGYVFSFLAIIAAMCDVIENICMLITIQNKPIEWIVDLTSDMARVKFSLIIIMILYIVVCLLFWMIDKLASQKKRPIL